MLESIVAFTIKLKPVEAANKEVSKALLNELEDIQWNANNETFFNLIELVDKKYLKNKLLDANTVSALGDFFKYSKDIWVWVHLGENKWYYEGSAPHRSNNNKGIDAVNKAIKQSQTFRCKLSISQFFDVSLRMNQEWSCGEDPNPRQLGLFQERCTDLLLMYLWL